MASTNPDRRTVLRTLRDASALAAGAGAGVLAVHAPAAAQSAASPLPASALRRIPSSGETVPAVGLGTWITFNVGADPRGRADAAAVVAAFAAAGGRVVDSSPMYGSAQAVVGESLARLAPAARARVFAADKVWVSPGARGPAQIEQSRRAWNVPRFDLLQVHNLLAWEEHLPALLAMKREGRVRLVGITTSEGRRHREIEAVMKAHPIDAVQVSYNLIDRDVEQRILPLAAERGIAVLVNRPFRQGDLLRDLARHPLPPWSAAIGCRTWAEVALLFAISHPAVTCAIPATTRVDHVRENVAVAAKPLPDAALRRTMAAHVAAL